MLGPSPEQPGSDPVLRLVAPLWSFLDVCKVEQRWNINILVWRVGPNSMMIPGAHNPEIYIRVEECQNVGRSLVLSPAAHFLNALSLESMLA